MIAPVLTPENQEKWIPAAQTLSKRELEKEIAKDNPKLAIQEAMRPICEGRVELRTGLSEELHEKIKRVQDLVSSKTKKAASIEDTLQALVDLYLEKEDPIEKAKRAKSPVPGQVPNTDPIGIGRKSLPARVRHAVTLRDQGQCTHVNDRSERCGERRWLETHHQLRLTHGGSNRLDNLTTLCSGHHRLTHSSWKQ